MSHDASKIVLFCQNPILQKNPPPIRAVDFWQIVNSYFEMAFAIA